MSDLVGNPEDRFYRNTSHFISQDELIESLWIEQNRHRSEDAAKKFEERLDISNLETKCFTRSRHKSAKLSFLQGGEFELMLCLPMTRLIPLKGL